MSLAVLHSRALDGLDAPPVRVEVHLANGLPQFTLVGLADTEVKEARERVRAALAESGFACPHNQRITVSLAPADLPKASGRFDQPIATTVEASDRFFPAEAYHQDFVRRNPAHPYVVVHDLPKLVQFRATFPELRR